MTSPFRIFVDWDNDGDFTDSYDEITEDVISMSWQLGMSAPFQHVADGGKAVINVLNTDGKYTPENSSGTLYGKLLPRLPVKIAWGTGTVISNLTELWNGRVKYYDLEYGEGGSVSGKMYARIECEDYKTLLDEFDIQFGVLENTNAGTVVTNVIDQVTGLSLEKDATYTQTIEYVGGEPENRAYDLIKDAVEIEYGRFWIDRRGTAVLRNRNVFSQSQAVPARFLADTETAGTSANFRFEYQYYSKGLVYSFGEELRTHVNVQVNPITQGTAITGWELEKPIRVGAGKSRTIKAVMRNQSTGQFVSLRSPSAGSVSFSEGTATITITGKGGRADVTVDNTAGAVTCQLDVLTIAGTPVTRQNKVYVDKYDGGTATYGIVSHNVRLNLLTDADQADNMAGYELLRRGTVNMAMIRQFTTFGSVATSLPNRYPTTFAVAYGSVGAYIRLENAAMSHAGNYYVIGEAHKVDVPERTMYSTFTVERQDSINPWLLGVETAEWGIGFAPNSTTSYSSLGVSTYLGF